MKLDIKHFQYGDIVVIEEILNPRQYIYYLNVDGKTIKTIRSYSFASHLDLLLDLERDMVYGFLNDNTNREEYYPKVKATLTALLGKFIHTRAWGQRGVTRKTKHFISPNGNEVEIKIQPHLTMSGTVVEWRMQYTNNLTNITTSTTRTTSVGKDWLTLKEVVAPLLDIVDKEIENKNG